MVTFRMYTCNLVNIPLKTNQQLIKAEDVKDLAGISLYQQLIGSLIYLVIEARPDLAFMVLALS